MDSVALCDVDRARMACRRCECDRRRGRRVTQKVGVMRHSACRGNLGRQESVRKVMVWGRESRRGRSVVWVGAVGSRPAIYGFGVTLKARAVVAQAGRPSALTAATIVRLRNTTMHPDAHYGSLLCRCTEFP